MEKMIGNERCIWVDNLKGFLIILVVAGHVLQSAIDAHIQSVFMESIFLWIYSFHMPLFFCVSGYVYSLTLRKKIKTDEFWQKWKIRIYSLTYLYFVYSLLMWTFKYLFFNGYAKEEVDIQNLALLPLQPISVYWFIYLLIGFFLIIPLYEKKNKFLNYKSLLFLCFVQCVSIHIELPFYLNRFMYMLPFFAVGVLLDNFKDASIKYLLFILVLACIAEIFSFREAAVIRACLWSWLFVKWFRLQINRRYRLITYAGENCLSIYLFHPYVVAGMKTILFKVSLFG